MRTGTEKIKIKNGEKKKMTDEVGSCLPAVF